MFMNETISRTKYVFQNESIREVRNESIRKVGTKYSRTNQFSSLGTECIVTIVQLYYAITFVQAMSCSICIAFLHNVSFLI